MTYEDLDDDELLALSLDAMNGAPGADVVVMLKALVERNRNHAHAQYLLAAQYAQMGFMEKAESGFRAAVALAPELTMARLQLGQLLLLKGEPDQAVDVLSALQSDPDPALSAYAETFLALARNQVPAAIERLEVALASPQAVPILAEDMHRLLASLRAEEQQQPAAIDQDVPAAGASLFLSNYGRHN